HEAQSIASGRQIPSGGRVSEPDPQMTQMRRRSKRDLRTSARSADESVPFRDGRSGPAPAELPHAQQQDAGQGDQEEQKLEETVAAVQIDSEEHFEEGHRNLLSIGGTAHLFSLPLPQSSKRYALTLRGLTNGPTARPRMPGSRTRWQSQRVRRPIPAPWPSGSGQSAAPTLWRRSVCLRHQVTPRFVYFPGLLILTL